MFMQGGPSHVDTFDLTAAGQDNGKADPGPRGRNQTVEIAI
jgi:hypothetical protein